MKILGLLFTILVFVDIPSVYATTPCYRNGIWYEHDEIVGGYRCNCGTWEEA